MPKKQGYGRRRLAGRPSRAIVRQRQDSMIRQQVNALARRQGHNLSARAVGLGLRMGSTVAEVYEAAKMYHYMFTKGPGAVSTTGRSNATPLQQTRATTRASKFSKYRKPSVAPGRNEKLNKKSAEPAKKGKGHRNIKQGTIVTHPRSVIPAWKYKRLFEYKYDVWQTVLLSKSNRLAGSPNTLQTSRYPIKAPECLDSEKTMTMIFTPFCSHKSGIHSTMYQHVNGDGDNLTHATGQLLDVIQNKADTQRWRVDNKYIEANQGPIIAYAGSHGASATAGPDNVKAVKRYFDQLVKMVKIDLTFTASRAFPVIVSVSLVRAIKPMEPFTLSTSDKRELCNAVGNHGMDYKSWVTEWHHEFTLPGLRVNKKPPTHNIHVNAKCNWLQTNSFNENTTATDYAESGTTALGSNIDVHTDEIADGQVSSQFYILIKYRKKQQPQQFIYKQVIEADSDSTSSRFGSASVELPVVTEESFDVPTHDGITGADGTGTQFETGAPLTNNQGNESKASFYLNGRLMYNWGFKQETESLPSVMSSATSNTNFKKPQSLMIDPTYDMTNQTYGLYQQSPDHVNRSASSAE